MLSMTDFDWDRWKADIEASMTDDEMLQVLEDEGINTDEVMVFSSEDDLIAYMQAVYHPWRALRAHRFAPKGVKYILGTRRKHRAFMARLTASGFFDYNN